MTTYRRSQNGWPVHASSYALTPLRWVTGRVVDGDVHAVFDHFCTRFDAEVEPIIRAHSWGYAFRAIRGRVSGYSNHASGTAIDLNAPAHPLGKRGTFTGAQAEKIRSLLRDYDGAIRWGGDYKNRADEMHFEVDADAEHLARVVAALASEPEPVRPETPTVLDLIRGLDSLRTDASVGWMRARLWAARAMIRPLHKGGSDQDQPSALPDDPAVLDLIRGIDKTRAEATVPWMRARLWLARRIIRPLYEK